MRGCLHCRVRWRAFQGARDAADRFPGGIYAHLFYVADVQASGAAMNGEVNVGLDTAIFSSSSR